MKIKSSLSVLVPLIIAGVSISAFSAETKRNDAIGITNVKISLGEAVATAEHLIDGKASRAEYELHKGIGVFDVEVVKGKKVMEVKVDAGNGKVLASTVDVTDYDDAGDLED